MKIKEPLMTFNADDKHEHIWCSKLGLLESDLKSSLIFDDGFQIKGKKMKMQFIKNGKLYYWAMIIPLGILALFSIFAIQVFINYKGIKATPGGGLLLGLMILVAGPYVAGILIFYFGREGILFLLTEENTIFFKNNEIRGYKIEPREPGVLCVTFEVKHPRFDKGSFTFYLKESSGRKQVFREFLNGFSNLD
jgi:hypothetical protein